MSDPPQKSRSSATSNLRRLIFRSKTNSEGATSSSQKADQIKGGDRSTLHEDVPQAEVSAADAGFFMQITEELITEEKVGS